uniref:Uncharacterized protein n=1 Tax=Kalanchoe fedtschenkoi TaxID=63787 RepID=A0A7N0UMH2_KALFE
MTIGARVGTLDYLEMAKIQIETCLLNFMNLEETMEYLWREAGISRQVTSIIWRRLEKENDEFFRAYNIRLVVLQQIKTFNMLLGRQAELMNIQNATSHHDESQEAPRFDQNLQSFSYDQLTGFSDMASTVPHSAIALPLDSYYSSYSSWPVGAPNDIVSAQNSNLQQGFSECSLMHQNYSDHFSSAFATNENIPQLPMMHESSMLPLFKDQIADRDMPLWPSDIDIHFPMSTEDDTSPFKAPEGR